MTFRNLDRVHFVRAPDRVWPELREAEFEPLSGAVLQKRCVDGLDAWVIRSSMSCGLQITA